MKVKKKRRASDIIAIIIMIVAIGVFLYAAYHLFLIFSEYQKGEEEYDTLREYVSMQEDTETFPEDGTENEGETKPADEVLKAPITADFQSLLKVNPDIVGWVYVEAVPEISYPIVQGTDNSYYLTHTVEGIENSSASIFIDYRNGKDWEDANTIIYGHNMKNLSMFGRLKNLKEAEVIGKSRYIWILTPEKDLCYEIFSVRDVPETDVLYSTFQLGEAEFKPLLEEYQEASLLAFEQEFDGTEKVITLSTCTSNNTVRCVVQAVRTGF